MSTLVTDSGEHLILKPDWHAADTLAIRGERPTRGTVVGSGAMNLVT